MSEGSGQEYLIRVDWSKYFAFGRAAEHVNELEAVGASRRMLLKARRARSRAWTEHRIAVVPLYPAGAPLSPAAVSFIRDMARLAADLHWKAANHG